jgi:hypothetical protein
MSYLQRPRLHFFGSFETDVSTVNNDPTHFNSGTFEPQFDLPQSGNVPNGWWNPTGTAMFRVFDTRVSSVCYQDGTDKTAGDGGDPVLSMQISDAGDRVPGKLVDLDSEQQMVSQIWGMRLRLMTADGDVAFSARYVVAPFCEIWIRSASHTSDSKFSAVYQSQLADVTWKSGELGPFLHQLREVAGDGPLSIRFVVDGYEDNSAKPGFRIGRIAGTIGAARQGEPVHLVRGRQLFSALMNQPGFPFAPPRPAFYNAVGYLDRARATVVLDLSNSIATNADYTIRDIGPLWLGTMRGGGFEALGEIAYRDAGWYARTAGIVEVAIRSEGTDLDERLERLEETALVVMGTNAAGADVPLASEAYDGTYVRADDFVLRLSPQDQARVALYATRYGKPLAYADVSCFDDSQNTLAMGAPNPNVGVPLSALTYPGTVRTNADGIAYLPMAAFAPGNARVYIDGQVYGVRPVLGATQAAKGVVNPLDFVSVLVFDDVGVPAAPTWWGDVQPILQQYANLYPVMRQVLDLGDYESVVAHKEMLRLVFSLPVEDPNYMPVTRDLSPAKRDMILAWLSGPGEPALGHAPPLGTIVTPPQSAAPVAPADLVASAAEVRTLAAGEPPEPDDAAHLSGKSSYIATTARGRREETP